MRLFEILEVGIKAAPARNKQSTARWSETYAMDFPVCPLIYVILSAHNSLSRDDGQQDLKNIVIIVVFVKDYFEGGQSTDYTDRISFRQWLTAMRVAIPFLQQPNNRALEQGSNSTIQQFFLLTFTLSHFLTVSRIPLAF